MATDDLDWIDDELFDEITAEDSYARGLLPNDAFDHLLLQPSEISACPS